MKFLGNVLAAIVLLIIAAPTTADAQRRDYLTDEEIEIVREAQQIDERIGVLVHAVDRRMAVIGLGNSANGRSVKEKDIWGPSPSGTRAEMLSDIERIIQKAIDDIDNLAARPDSAIINEDEGKKPKDPKALFSKAVRSLGSAAVRYRPIFNDELSKTEVKAERGLLLDIIEDCDEIIEAVAKLPTEMKKGKN
ncbi:MAG: hypothetical protein K1X36_10390 [Pyrinomonadaceae bacterium]|nr:hypothetical protein [Pyrinomonadaceae bacterium]